MREKGKTTGKAPSLDKEDLKY